jgi:hypothetical protein
LQILLLNEFIGVRLLGRRRLFAPVAHPAVVAMIHPFSAILPLWPFAPLCYWQRSRVVVAMIFHTRQCRPDQFPVGKVFSFSRFPGRGGVHHNFFHRGATSDTSISGRTTGLGPCECNIDEA